MIKMAPGKPIFITQTASSSITRLGEDAEAKDQWFRENYTHLAANPSVKGIMYFNINKECDWALYSDNNNPSNNQKPSEGYKQAIAHPAFGYVPPNELFNIDLQLSSP